MDLYVLKIYFTPNLLLEKNFEKHVDLGNNKYSYYVGGTGKYKLILTDAVPDATYSTDMFYMFDLEKRVSENFSIPPDKIHVVNANDTDEEFEMPF